MSTGSHSGDPRVVAATLHRRRHQVLVVVLVRLAPAGTVEFWRYG